MSVQAIFWFVAGAMSGAAACLLSAPLWRRLRELRRAGSATLSVLAAVTAVAVAAGVLYAIWGRPEALDSTAVHSGPHAGEVTGNGNPAAGESVEAATQKLALRLDTRGGSSADWQLLAQSYEYLGRADEAAAARERAKSATAGTAANADMDQGAAGANEKPPAAQALLAQAESYRRSHDYAHATDTYRRLADLHAMSADDWANYADAAASANDGRLQGAPAGFLKNALQIDPDHPKALWLQASLLLEQHRYAEAQLTWEHLSKVLPKDSPDASIVASNITEARTLAAAAGPGPSGVAGPTGAQISGEVDIDSALRSKAAAGMTLFIFAKSTDSPGPPLAVLRMQVGRWPVKFSLNESQAMLPQRTLADFRSVIVEARVSSGGQPLAQAGDLQGDSSAVDPRSDKPVRVVIRDVVAP